MDDMAEKELQRNWEERGFSFATGTIKVGDKVDDAVHDDKDELVVIATGKLEFTVGSDTFTPGQNVEVFIPARSRHTIINIGSEDSKILYGYKPLYS